MLNMRDRSRRQDPEKEFHNDMAPASHATLSAPGRITALKRIMARCKENLILVKPEH
jgi:hypothetical protein